MRILLVKLSSMGDVIHNLPVASDIARAMPGATIDWVTEAAYAPLVAQHPAVSDVIIVRLRALKSAWYSPAAWLNLLRDKSVLTARRYDAVIDTQGLSKSAVIANWANGVLHGYDAASIREPLACRWYAKQHAVARELHAVTRNRRLAAAALGYQIDETCDYGISKLAWPPSLLALPYVVLLHATSRRDKEWSLDAWRALGQACNDSGYAVVLPSGNEAEFTTSERIASGLSNAKPMRAQSLDDTALLLAHATCVVGTDTGLSHLAVALERPTVGLYLATQPALTGLFGQNCINLGGGARESRAHVEVAEVLTALRSLRVKI